MDPARYAKLHELYDEARALGREQRARFVERVSRDDGELGLELEGLLHALADSQAQEGSESDGARALLREDAIGAARQRLESLHGGASPLGLMPERIAGFRILRLIGEGGMGVVYEAEQDSPRRRVALKMIHPTLGSGERLRRFRLEAELLGRLQHPGIAQIHECGAFDLGRGAQPYFVMELVEGVDLRSYSERAALDVGAKLELVARIADAVHHAHERGVVHRDLKPDNVLIDADGRPKVLDFGVARASDTSVLLSTAMTRTGELVGTLGYMAPEQLAGDPEAITPRADVYALGAMLFQLLAGRMPHDVSGLPIAAAVQVLTVDEPEKLSRIDTRLRGDVETIVAKAMEKDPARRYATAAALASDIRRYLQHRPITARPASRIYRAVKFTRRNKALVFGVTATLAASIVALVFAVRADETALESRANERQARAGVLQMTQALLESGEAWRAASTFRQLHGSSSGWEHEFVLRAVPVMLPEPWTRAAIAWVDEDHLALPAGDGDGAAVIDLRGWREVRRFLRGEAVVRVETFPDAEWTGSDRDKHFWVDLASGRELHRVELGDSDAGIGQRITLDAQGRFRDFRYDAAAGAWIVSIDGREVARAVERAPQDGVVLFPSPDGSRAITVDARGGVLRAFDTDTGAVLGELSGLRASSCARALFMPDGREVLTYDAALRPVIVDVERVEIVRRHERITADTCEGGDLTRDGALYAHYSGGRVEVWELATDRLVFSQPVGFGPETVGRVCFSPSGRRLFVAAQDLWSCVLDLSSEPLDPKLLATDDDPRVTSYRGHSQYAYDVALSPDGRLVASSSVVEPCVRLWDAATGETVAVLDKPVAASAHEEARGRLMAFSPDGRRLLATLRSGADAPRLFVWDLLTGAAETETLPGELANAMHAAWIDRFVERLGPAPAMRLGRMAVLTSDGTALAIQHRGYSAPPGTRWRTFVDRNDEEALELSPDGRRVAVACARCVRIYDRENPTGARGELGQVPGQAYCVAWSPDGRLIAAGGVDGRIRLIDAETLTQLIAFRAHDDYVFALAWTPDGSRLVSASGDSRVRVWDPRRPDVRAAEVREYQSLREPITALDDDARLRRFAAASSIAERGAIVRVALDRRAESAGR